MLMVKQFFLSLNRISHILFCACRLLLCQWELLRKVFFHLVYIPNQVIIHMDEIPLTLFFSRVKSQLSLSLYVKCFSPLVISVVLCWSCSHMSVFRLYWEPQTWAWHSDMSHKCWAEEKDHLSWPVGNVLPNAAHQAVGLLGHQGTLLADVKLVHQQPQSPFLQNSFPEDWPLVHPGAWGLFLPRCRTLHFPLLNFMKCLLAHFSCLSRSPLTASQPSGVAATHLSFVYSANLLTIHSAHHPCH